MKKILITGKGSYIGLSFKNYVDKLQNGWSVEELELCGDDWKSFDFSNYDTILHVAGIAHVREKDVGTPVYYQINRDLAIDVAQKAKVMGVKQFIFLSTVAIYPEKVETIDRTTIPAPYNSYGESKYQAEQGLQNLCDESFRVIIARIPMVYGQGCKGNFQNLVVFAKWCCIFPRISNQRSMIYIDNLSSFFVQMIVGDNSGIFFPQDSIYISTDYMIAAVRKSMGKQTYLIPGMATLIRFLAKKSKTLSKIFGNKILVVEDNHEYARVDFNEAIQKSVMGVKK